MTSGVRGFAPSSSSSSSASSSRGGQMIALASLFLALVVLDSPGSLGLRTAARADVHDGYRREYEQLFERTEDKDSLDAIRQLHEQLDDDNDGTIEPSETGDFIKEDLNLLGNGSGDHKSRASNFHSKDAEITVKDLWTTWVRSEVYNWTTEQVVDWLTGSVELPQYGDRFRAAGVNGTHLPKAAVSTSFLAKAVGVTSSIHRSKISLKAMDVVLFGPPRDQSNFVKDLILTTLLVIAVSGFFYMRRQNKKATELMQRMNTDMDQLAKAEEALQAMQRKLSLKESKIESLSSTPSDLPDAVEVSRLKEELELLRSELNRAEVELEDKCWMASPVLQHWLQLTYELESQTFAAKRRAAEEQLEMAKDMCEKLKKKRSSLVGAFVSTHGRSIDDVDRSILEAKTALIEVTKDLSERSQRWRQIEMLCGCTIVNNPGLNALKSLVRHVGVGRGHHPAGSVVQDRLGLGSRLSSMSQEELAINDADFDRHSVAPSHVGSHMSRPASVFSAATTASAAAHFAAAASRHHTRLRGEAGKSMSRESSKESSSSDELDRASNFTSSSEVNPNLAIAVARGMSTPPVSKTSSPAAMKRAKMMVKSYSQDACGVGGSAAASPVAPVTTASSVINVPVTTPHMTTSVSEGHLQQQQQQLAKRASNSPSLSSSRSGSSISKGAEGAAASALSASKPSIVEELEESCSASDSGSVTDLSGSKKKKKSFFHFKRKKDKKVEM